jgi:exopolyphosphatase/guanosine-5'-triphosphate,3'-diphosphate pyrophosphatase
MKYAAIDIGTNAARLLIGEVVISSDHSYVKKLSYTRVPLRLGFEVFTDGVISSDKTKEFIKTIKAFQLLAELYQVDGLRACATSAMREAINGKEVRDQIAKETGVHIDIIEGEEEAEIIFSTFFLIAVDKTTPFIVIDVGGGSTEISVFENGNKVSGKSFQVGTIRLLKNKVNDTVFDEISGWIRSEIDTDIDHKVFATGGNINKMHKLLAKLKAEPIEFRELKEFKKELETLSIHELTDKYELKPDRADVLPAASQIFFTVAKTLGRVELYVPKIGLSDGMIYTMHLAAEQAQKKSSENR